MPEETNHPFIQYLLELKERENRAALAHLRRGLGKPPGSVPEMYPYVVPWIQEKSDFEQRVYFLVASLFAMHQDNTLDGNLGRTFQIIWKDAGDSPSIEKRFVQLLNSHPDELPGRLRHAIDLAASKKVPVNYTQLLKDLRSWRNESRSVQKQWARQFWTPGQDKKSDLDAE